MANWTGDSQDNRRVGGDKKDYFWGRGGDDYLFGGVGDDYLYGEDGEDGLYGGVGDDRLEGGAGHDHLYGGDGDDHLEGGTGHDELYGGDGDDQLEGGAGDDQLLGGAGDDTLEGGAGSDTAFYYHSVGGVTVDLTRSGPQLGTKDSHATGDTLVSIENLYGSRHDDRLTGNAEANVLMGYAGADTLNGGGGSDTASYAGSAGGVTVDLTRSGPQQTTNSDGTDNHDAAGDTLVSIENLRGSYYADRLTGNAVANVLEGGAGGATPRPMHLRRTG